MRSSHVVVIGLALGGCLALAARSARSGGDDEMSATAPVGSNAPAIDRKAQVRVETATFAVG